MYYKFPSPSHLATLTANGITSINCDTKIPGSVTIGVCCAIEGFDKIPATNMQNPLKRDKFTLSMTRPDLKVQMLNESKKPNQFLAVNLINRSI
jgi:hypothetical protein